jgi:DNA-binding NtrC family response regulator
MYRNILLVDDEVAFLHPMKKMLYGPERNIDIAETYEEAMTFIRSRRYDAVVADVRLGGALSRDGLAILGYAKARDSSTKVILMTGYGGADVMNEAFRLRADHYFEKPVSFQRLSDALISLGVMQ